MNRNVEIDRVTPHQADALAPRLTRIALAAKRSWGYPEAWIREWTPELTFGAEDLARNPTWHARVDGEVVGFIQLGGVDPESGRCRGPGVELEHLWIEGEHHGLGLGRRLFEVLLGHARASGAAYLEVFSDPNAEGFYRRMGFRPHGFHHSTVAGEPRRLPILRLDLQPAPDRPVLKSTAPGSSAR